MRGQTIRRPQDGEKELFISVFAEGCPFSCSVEYTDVGWFEVPR